MSIIGGGRFEFDDGGFYVGEWGNGQAEGYGVCTGPKGIGKFEGLWKGGMEVSGFYSWPNEMWYKGEWKDGHRHNYGLQKQGDSKIYSGQWVNGIKHGSGILYSARSGKSVYEGTWKCGVQDGYGVEIYKEGYYAGQWKDGMRHGFGVRGQTEEGELTEASASLKQLIQSPTHHLMTGAANLDCLNGVFDQELPKRRQMSREIVENMRMSSSSLSRFTLQKSVSENTIASLGEDTAPTVEKKRRESIFHNFRPFRKSVVLKKHPENMEVYKGNWEEDQREGFGICYYSDGSRYIGEWKENRRHGYGILVDKENKKSGGKWYNDSLLLFTRRKNLKLPMMRKKMTKIVLAGLDAATNADKKLRLAVSRGLSSRKLSDVAKAVASVAERNAEQAVQCRRKYTLHPFLAESLSDFSRQNSSVYSSDSHPGDQHRYICPQPETLSLQSCSSSAAPSRKTSNESKTDHRRSATLPSFCSPPDNDLDLDVLKALEKHPANERCLYAAMDTAIAAGAVSPFVSQMILLNYNDAQTRMVRAMSSTTVCSTKRSTKTSTDSMFDSFNRLHTLNKWDSGEELDDRNNRNSGHRADSHSKSSLNKSRAFLHPNHFTTRHRRFGVDDQLSIDSFGLSSFTSEDAKLVKLEGKGLTGEDVNYDYIAVSTGLDGQETLVLYTNHRRPTYVKDHAVSEASVVNSATGLYRTVVGNLPSVLNVSEPTGIPALDNRPLLVGVSTKDGVLNDTSEKESLVSDVDHASSETDSVCSLSRSERSSAQSPMSIDNASSCNSSSEDWKKPSSHCNNDSNSQAMENRATTRWVNILPHKGIVQQMTIQKPRAIQTNFDSIPTSESNVVFKETLMGCTTASGRLNISDWLSKRLRTSRTGHSSLRSLSSDSGYKQSMSLDEPNFKSSSSSQLPDLIQSDEDGTLSETQTNKDRNTVVTIENDETFCRLNSMDKKKLSAVCNQCTITSIQNRSQQLSMSDAASYIEGKKTTPKTTFRLMTVCDDCSIVDNVKNDIVLKKETGIDKTIKQVDENLTAKGAVVTWV